MAKQTRERMMPTHVYRAYGLRIHAELACPELLPHSEEEGEPDVTIRLLPAGSTDLEPIESGYYEVQPGVFRLSVRDVAHYRVEDGRRIVIQPVPDAPMDKVRLFLLGSTMGALLYQRGLFPLHGSAVETPWGGMIFVGPQGAGKSTLAAQFRQRGYRLLSDDVCALMMTPDGLKILPALSQVRLCADAFERLEGSTGRFEVDKFVVPMGEGFCPYPVELRAVHLLSDRDGEVEYTETRPRFELVQGFNKVRGLLENLYRPHYLKGQGTQTELMRMAGVVAQRSTMAVVRRRRNTAEIGGLVDFLESEWAKRFASGSAEDRPFEEKIRCAV